MRLLDSSYAGIGLTSCLGDEFLPRCHTSGRLSRGLLDTGHSSLNSEIHHWLSLTSNHHCLPSSETQRATNSWLSIKILPLTQRNTVHFWYTLISAAEPVWYAIPKNNFILLPYVEYLCTTMKYYIVFDKSVKKYAIWQCVYNMQNNAKYYSNEMPYVDIKNPSKMQMSPYFDPDLDKGRCTSSTFNRWANGGYNKKMRKNLPSLTVRVAAPETWPQSPNNDPQLRFFFAAPKERTKPMCSREKWYER